MNSWAVWAVLIFVAALLGFVGYHFTVHTLRIVAGFIALAAAVFLTWYGLITHSAHAPSDLASAFTRGADAVSVALFRPLPVPSGDQIPAPGRVGWLVITVLLVLGYRELEAWAMRWQAPVLDTSALGGGQQRTPPDGGPDGSADGGPDAGPGEARDDTADGQRHDRLASELKFRLPAVEVRAPAVLPGGSRSNGLASIAEASGVSGSGLAGAIIRFAGMLWPNPRRFQVRVWLERGPRRPQDTGPMRVTVDLENLGSGESVATKTLAGSDLDEAVAMVAGYVARHIFLYDPTAPQWCVGAADGHDLAAMLLAKQYRGHSGTEDDVRNARLAQINILETGVSNNLCAGVPRYELAQLYDVTGNQVAALRLHAINREQYPRFYRGRYRLAMSLEMIANRAFELPDTTAAEEELQESLRILDRCGVTTGAARLCHRSAARELRLGLRQQLLAAAQGELREIRRQLTFRHIIWGTLRHRDERAVRKPFWRPRERQSFHDGVCVAELLVATRQSLDSDGASRASGRYLEPALRIAKAVTGDSGAIRARLTEPVPRERPPIPDPKWPPPGRRDRTRWLPWQCCTPSWGAAYNTACLYAALTQDPSYTEDEKTRLTKLAVASLERAVNNPDNGLERPYDWISQDPDFGCLHETDEYLRFIEYQKACDYPAATRSPGPARLALAAESAPAAEA